jgi:hypothetical protein
VGGCCAPYGEQVTRSLDELHTAIQAALDAGELTYESPRPGQFLVKLPGQHKLATMCWFVAGEHAVLVEAFVMRRPDENHETLYNLLLTRNSRMYGVSWAIDSTGDVFLVGRVSHDSISEDEIDRLLGAVLTYADETFDLLLEIGFGTAIRREWAWRAKNGESVANLQAFARFADPANIG